MVEPLAVQAVEANLIAFPEISQDISAASSESSDVSQSKLSAAIQNNPAALAARYEVSDRTVQNWVKRLVDECNIPDSQLRIQHGIEVEYSAYCLQLLDQLIEYRQVHGPKKIGQWFSTLAQSLHSQECPTCSTAEPAADMEDASGGQLAISSDNTDSQLALHNPFLNGINSEQAIDEGITDIETRIELLETRKMERSEFQNDLSSRIKTLALKGYQQGVLESEEGKDEFAVAYEQAAQEEIERIEREQRLEAIRAQARRDVQQAYDRSKKLGNEL